MDCGAACLSMVSRYYGKYHPVSVLRERCHAMRDGVSMLGLSEAAEGLGMRTMGVRIIFAQLAEEAVLPCIAHWKQNHFIVVHKVKARKRADGGWTGTVHVADPAHGLARLPVEDFLAGWESTRHEGEGMGIALLLEPTPAFYEQEDEKQRKRTLGGVLRYLKPYRSQAAQLCIGILVGSVLQLVFPFLTQSIVDHGIGNQDLNFVTLILVAQLVLFASQTMVEFIQSWILLHITARVNVSMISDFLCKLMKLPIRFFDTKLVGDLLQRIEDNSRVQAFLTRETLQTFFSFVTLVVFLVVLAVYDGVIFGVFLGASVLYVLWITAFLKKRRELDYRRFAQASAEQSNLYEMVTGMQEIKLQNCERQKRWGWEAIQAKLFRVSVQGLALSQWQQAGGAFINQLKNIVVSFLSARAVIRGEMSLGMMMAVQYIIGQLSVPVSQLANYLYEIQDVRISLDRIHEVKNKKDENEGRTALLDTAEPSISICNLSFRYEGMAEDVIRDVNLVVRPQETVAIVGSSGSGKTTLLKLMLQYYQPCEGCISIGGVDLRRVNLQSLWGRCGVVMQDGYIFSDTIARNIAATGGEVDHARLEYAADVAMLKDFVESLPLKYDTLIGDEGRNLSSGQRQRVLIARAVYKNPDILFFDEATNALDATNEKCILQNLETFLKGRTAVIIAHRLSTVKNADKIVVLEGGRIVENGTHAGLLAEHGAYYRLVKNQLELGG